MNSLVRWRRERLTWFDCKLFPQFKCYFSLVLRMVMYDKRAFSNLQNVRSRDQLSVSTETILFGKIDFSNS